MRLSQLLNFGLLIFFGVLLIFPLLLTTHYLQDIPVSLIVFTIFFSAILLILTIRFIRSLKEESHDSQVLKLEKKGDLISTDFKARRAFLVDEFEDEGIHYFIELENNSILFLSGQYLYDYEPTYFGEKESRKFPCTEFIVRRHRLEHFVIDIICKGEAFEPEFFASPFGDIDYEEDQIPQDGEIIKNRSYDELKQERIARSKN